MRVLRLLCSDLTGGKERTKINSFYSEFEKIIFFGVFILVPLCLNIYVNVHI